MASNNRDLFDFNFYSSLFNLLEQLIGAQERRIENQEHFRYTAEDLRWGAIFWFYRIPILTFLVALIAGIALYKGKKIGWILVIPMLVMLVIAGIFQLMIPYYPQMTIDFDYVRLMVLFTTILLFTVLVIMLLPMFWKPLHLNWFHLIMAITWLIIVTLNNDFY